MKCLILTVVLLAATTVLADNPYEYVDEALLQRVAQIVFEYDQKVAASRSSGGGAGASSFQQRSYQAPQVEAKSYNNDVGYQARRPEQASRGSNFNYNSNANSNYNYGQAGFRSQRQYGYQQPAMQQQQQQYVAPAPRTYQEPQMAQQGQVKSGFAYTLSQPEVAERVAEFHFTDGQQQQQSSRNYNSQSVPVPVQADGSNNIESNKFRYA